MKQLCVEFNVSSATVYNLSKSRKQFLKFSEAEKPMCATETMQDGDNTVHDQVMIEWVRYCISDGVELNPTKIMNQANVIHKGLRLQYKCDYGKDWLQRFQTRHGIALNNDTHDMEPTTGSKETDNQVMTRGNCNAGKTQRTKLLIIVKNKLPGALEGMTTLPVILCWNKMI